MAKIQYNKQVSANFANKIDDREERNFIDNSNLDDILAVLQGKKYVTSAGAITTTASGNLDLTVKPAAAGLRIYNSTSGHEYIVKTTTTINGLVVPGSIAIDNTVSDSTSAIAESDTISGTVKVDTNGKLQVVLNSDVKSQIDSISGLTSFAGTVSSQSTLLKTLFGCTGNGSSTKKATKGTYVIATKDFNISSTNIEAGDEIILLQDVANETSYNNLLSCIQSSEYISVIQGNTELISTSTDTSAGRVLILSSQVAMADITNELMYRPLLFVTTSTANTDSTRVRLDSNKFYFKSISSPLYVDLSNGTALTSSSFTAQTEDGTSITVPENFVADFNEMLTYKANCMLEFKFSGDTFSYTFYKKDEAAGTVYE